MTDSNDVPKIPDTVAEMFADRPEGFDPRNLPGAEVMFDDGDSIVVAVPISSIPDGDPADYVQKLGETDEEGIPVLGEFLQSVIREAGGGAGVLDFAMGQISQLSLAMEENDKARERHGESDPEGPIADAFPLAACIEQPYMTDERIFRAHCATIYDRAAKGEDVRPGTDAEMLGLVIEQAELYPFCAGLTVLYFRLVRRVVPDLFPDFLREYREVYPEAGHPDFEDINREDADHHETEIRELLTRDRRPKGM
jgi:hypothetical protein